MDMTVYNGLKFKVMEDSSAENEQLFNLETERAWAAGLSGRDAKDWIEMCETVNSSFRDSLRIKKRTIEMIGSITIATAYTIGDNRFHSVCPTPEVARRVTRHGDSKEARLLKVIAHCTKLKTPDGWRSLTLQDIDVMPSGTKNLLVVAFGVFQAPGKIEPVVVGALDLFDFPSSLLSAPELAEEKALELILLRLHDWLFKEESQPDYTLELEIKALAPPLIVNPQIQPNSPNFAA
jgi:hypothetical protein